jgi:hypothetical protein
MANTDTKVSREAVMAQLALLDREEAAADLTLLQAFQVVVEGAEFTKVMADLAVIAAFANPSRQSLVDNVRNAMVNAVNINPQFIAEATRLAQPPVAAPVM